MRIKTSKFRLNDLLRVMIYDDISTTEKVYTLKHELADHYHNLEFLQCHTMGEIVHKSLQVVV